MRYFDGACKPSASVNLNHHLVDKAALALMKPTTIVGNTSRGEVVSAQDGAEALHEKSIKVRVSGCP